MGPRPNYTKDIKTMISGGHKIEARRQGGQAFSGHGTQSYSQDDDIQDITPVDIKTEVPGNQVYESAPSDTVYEGDGTMASYDESYDYDPQYAETDYDSSIAPGDLQMGKQQCRVCQEWYHPASIKKRHIKEQHSQSMNIECNICGKKFPNNSTYGNHCRRVHNVYKS